MLFNFVAKSDLGQVRKINEDASDGLIVNNTMFLIVADGFGISDDSNGDPAGQLIVNEVKNFISKFYVMATKEFASYILDECFYLANKTIRNYQKSNPQIYKGYGCSLSICAILPSYEMVISHVGITRLYMIRNNEVFLGTDDHNKAYPLLKQGVMSKEEYEISNDRNVVTNGLGINEDIVPFKTNVMLYPNDFILLASDGVYRLLGDERLKNLIYEAGELETACQWLIDGANHEGGLDNLSAIVSYIK